MSHFANIVLWVLCQAQRMLVMHLLLLITANVFEITLTVRSISLMSLIKCTFSVRYQNCFAKWGVQRNKGSAFYIFLHFNVGIFDVDVFKRHPSSK